MRSVLVGLLVLLALLSINTASALKTNTVRSNNALVTVTTVDAALIGIAPGTTDANAAGSASYNDNLAKNTISISFQKGLSSGTAYGFAPNIITPTDKFFYRNLLTLKNKSGQRQCVAVYLTSGSAPDLAEIQVRPMSTAAGTLSTGPATWRSAARLGCQWMDPGLTYAVDFLWLIQTAAPTSPLTNSFGVTVEAHASAW